MCVSLQEDRAVRHLPGQHQGDDPSREQDAVVHCGSRGPHARQRRRRARESAAVLCVGYARDGAVGDWRECEREIRFSLIGKRQDLTHCPVA